MIVDTELKKNIETNYSLLVDTAILLGEIMLKNGAETHVVEMNMDKLLRTTNMKHIEAVVMTTSIIVTLSDPSIKHITAVSRIHARITNLNRVNEASILVKKYCENKINLEELFQSLKNLKNYNQFDDYVKAIALCLIPPAFTIMLNGKIIDAVSALICGILLVILNRCFSKVDLNTFVKNTLTIMLVSISSAILSVVLKSNTQIVITGFIMPYVPGIAITNAARDTFNEDYMSGVARLFDALVQAFSVALGAFIGLYIESLIF